MGAGGRGEGGGRGAARLGGLGGRGIARLFLACPHLHEQPVVAVSPHPPHPPHPGRTHFKLLLYRNHSVLPMNGSPTPPPPGLLSEHATHALPPWAMA